MSDVDASDEKWAKGLIAQAASRSAQAHREGASDDFELSCTSELQRILSKLSALRRRASEYANGCAGKKAQRDVMLETCQRLFGEANRAEACCWVTRDLCGARQLMSARTLDMRHFRRFNSLPPRVAPCDARSIERPAPTPAPTSMPGRFLKVDWGHAPAPLSPPWTFDLMGARSGRPHGLTVNDTMACHRYMPMELRVTSPDAFVGLLAQVAQCPTSALASLLAEVHTLYPTINQSINAYQFFSLRVSMACCACLRSAATTTSSLAAFLAPRSARSASPRGARTSRLWLCLLRCGRPRTPTRTACCRLSLLLRWGTGGASRAPPRLRVAPTG